jgi:L-cystine transport system substrate-binding protein
MISFKQFKIILGVVLGIVILGTAAGCGNKEGDSAAAGSASQVKTYVVATRGTAKPFSYTDDKGNLTGYDVEILKEVEKRDPTLKFDFQPIGVDAAFVAMDAGKVDIIANQMVKNPAREKKYIYTKEINNYTARKLVVKKGRNDIHSLDDLKGKKMALTANSEMSRIVRAFNETADVPIDIVYNDKGSVENLNQVATGRVDAAGEYVYVTDAFQRMMGMPVEAVGSFLKLNGQAFLDTHFLLRKDENSQKLADRLDEDLKTMRADGTLKKLSVQFLGADYTVEPEE